MAGRVATSADYSVLNTRWAAALISTRANWPQSVSDIPPDWSQYNNYVSTDASGIRFGLATVKLNQTLNNIDFPDGLKLAEQAPFYIGPRAGLAPSQFVTAVGEVIVVWAAGARSRGAVNGDALCGIVPVNWGRFQPFTSRGWKVTPLYDNMVVLYDVLGRVL